MNGSRLIQQVTAIFSIFMVFFYLGVGIYLIWFADSILIDRAVKVLLGSAFLLYGIFRALRAWEKINEAYFIKDEDDSSSKKKYGSWKNKQL